jgi:hypothetical protein
VAGGRKGGRNVKKQVPKKTDMEPTTIMQQNMEERLESLLSREFFAKVQPRDVYQANVARSDNLLT